MLIKAPIFKKLMNVLAEALNNYKITPYFFAAGEFACNFIRKLKTAVWLQQYN